GRALEDEVLFGAEVVEDAFEFFEGEKAAFVEDVVEGVGGGWCCGGWGWGFVGVGVFVVVFVFAFVWKRGCLLVVRIPGEFGKGAYGRVFAQEKLAEGVEYGQIIGGGRAVFRAVSGDGQMKGVFDIRA